MTALTVQHWAKLEVIAVVVYLELLWNLVIH